MQLYVHNLEIDVLNEEIYILDVFESKCMSESELDSDEEYGDDDYRDFQCCRARYLKKYILNVSESMCV